MLEENGKKRKKKERQKMWKAEDGKRKSPDLILVHL